ncbi:MAG TPA: hypothetical protein VMF05_15840 [Stellaceae bacterium]|nr:hypothetical protein [Stellaceae bacterium]
MADLLNRRSFRNDGYARDDGNAPGRHRNDAPVGGAGCQNVNMNNRNVNTNNQSVNMNNR